MSKNESPNYILEYYQKIKDGSVVVGQWIEKAYEYIVEGLEAKRFYFNQKKATLGIKFMENFVRHHEGELAPQHLKLELWQKAMVSVIFGIVNEEGVRQFTEIFCVVARKNGKTLLGSGIAETCLYVDGEYGGRIYFCAPKLEQANLCFNALCQSVYKEPLLDQITQKRRTDLYVGKSNSTAKPLAFSATKSDGFNISCGICDEISSWSGNAGLKFYEVLKSSQGARKQPLIFSMTTAGYVNDGVYDELFLRATNLLKGTSKETRFMPFLYTIDEPEKWNDINELRKANPNMSVSVSVDYMLNEIAIAETSLSKKYEFLTKYCNVKQNSSQAWLEVQDINKCFSGNELRLDDFKESYAVCGIDLSRTTDLTCATCIIEKNSNLYIFAKFFMPRNKLEELEAKDNIPYHLYEAKGWLEFSGDNFVDYKDCYKWITNLIEEYKIYPLYVGYDRYSAQYLIQDLQAYGFKTDDVNQGFNLSPVIREMEGLIKDGRIDIGNNDLMKIHLLDTAVKTDSETDKLKIVKVSEHVHIDGVASLLDALCVRQKYWEEIGEQLKN